MMIDDPIWQAIARRDQAADGKFVYAVDSTGIFCRPSCPSRRPKRENVRAYALADLARKAGYRPCRRCLPESQDSAADPILAKVKKTMAVLDREADLPPNLEDLGREVGASPYHLQRIFTRVVGISPRDYADALRLKRLKALLRNGDGVAGALYEAGYGSASRLYEKSDAKLGMTPATYRKGGAGAAIAYAVAPCPLGRLLVAATAKGVAALYLGADDAALLHELEAEFPRAELSRDDGALDRHVASVLAYLAGRAPSVALPLDVQSTAFQRQVWKALQNIPAGETRSYKDIAAAIGKPKAARAVGRACASNPAALVIPCHRAVGSDGALHGYRWGLERKDSLLKTEARLKRSA